jgi:hypothetical protein
MFKKIQSIFYISLFVIVGGLHAWSMCRNFQLERMSHAYSNLFFILYCGVSVIYYSMILYKLLKTQKL